MANSSAPYTGSRYTGPFVDYDAVSSYRVYPQSIVEHAKKIEENATVITESLNRIIATYASLKLGWAGKTAQEAEDFSNRWIAVGEELYGPRGKPKEGVLYIVLSGVQTAAYLFAHAEQGIAYFFDQLSIALLKSDSSGKGGGPARGPGGPGPAGSDEPAQIPVPGDSVVDVNTTAITETW